jgi:hypothetical protein
MLGKRAKRIRMPGRARASFLHAGIGRTQGISLRCFLRQLSKITLGTTIGCLRCVEPINAMAAC